MGADATGMDADATQDHSIMSDKLRRDMLLLDAYQGLAAAARNVQQVLQTAAIDPDESIDHLLQQAEAIVHRAQAEIAQDQQDIGTFDAAHGNALMQPDWGAPEG